jgi:hypothetical protein
MRTMASALLSVIPDAGISDWGVSRSGLQRRLKAGRRRLVEVDTQVS